MPLQQRVVQHYPATQVLVYTKSGLQYNLTAPGTNSFRSWSTHKDTTTPTGQFSLNLTAVRDANGRTWADKIGAMDYVEIRAGDYQRASPLPVIMRGFVDSAQETISVDPSTGVPTRTVQVTGQDWGKLLNIWQVQYLWPLDPITAALTLTTPMPIALSTIFSLPWNTGTMGDFVSSTTKDVVHPVWQQISAVYQGTVPMVTGKVAFPPQAQVAVPYVEDFTGSFWNLLTYYQSPPFGEAFIVDENSGVDFVYRLAPYLDITGNAPTLYTQTHNDGHALYPDVVADIVDVVAKQTGHSDTDVATYFFVTPDSSIANTLNPAFYVSGATAPAAVSSTSTAQLTHSIGSLDSVLLNRENAGLPTGPQNPIYLMPYIPIYGFRALTVQTPWLSAIISEGKLLNSVQSAASDLCWWLYQVFGNNMDFSNGSVILHGHSDYRIGRYLQLKDDGFTSRYYIMSVDHQFTQAEPGQPLGTWQTTLGLSRGYVM